DLACVLLFIVVPSTINHHLIANPDPAVKALLTIFNTDIRTKTQRNNQRIQHLVP
ncbi:hypothetical protein AALO_G00163190, partial [Alosa alosa]